jgi:hypothetical protein
MGQMQTTLASLCLTFASALPLHADDLKTFALCTGRLSALMEHQWLMQDPAANVTQRQRDAFADLIAAVEAPDQARRSMALRIEAKVATAAALQAADFGGQPMARLRVMAQVKSCLRLLPQA